MEVNVSLLVILPTVTFARPSPPSRASRGRRVGPAKKYFPRLTGSLAYLIGSPWIPGISSNTLHSHVWMKGQKSLNLFKVTKQRNSKAEI